MDLIKSKKGQGNANLNMYLKGGVPLAFVLFGFFMVCKSLNATPNDIDFMIIGFLSAGVGAYLFYEVGVS